MKPPRRPPAIDAGSAEPSDHAHVEGLLRFVPHVAFEPEFAACIANASDAPFEVVWDDERRGRVVKALHRLRARAVAERNGGLSFLARTLAHFLDAEPIAATEHPLLVALYLRDRARKSGQEDDPVALGLRMNDWKFDPATND